MGVAGMEDIMAAEVMEEAMAVVTAEGMADMVAVIPISRTGILATDIATADAGMADMVDAITRTPTITSTSIRLISVSALAATGGNPPLPSLPGWPGTHRQP